MHVQDVRTVVSIDIFLYLLLDCLNSCQRIRVTAYIHTYHMIPSFLTYLLLFSIQAVTNTATTPPRVCLPGTDLLGFNRYVVSSGLLIGDGWMDG